MRHGVWASGLISVMLVVNNGCRSQLPTKASAAVERTIQVPGNYVAPDVDRGSPPTIADPGPSAQDILAGLPVGRVLFACPPTMKVQVSERVEVRISGNPNDNLAVGLQERGVPIEQSAKIAPVMKVMLTPEEKGAFDVQPLSEEEQLTSSEGFSQWVWSVTPRKSGTHSLYLTVNVVVNVPQLGPQKRQIPVLTQPVTVRADPVYSAGRFWSSNWQWFTTTLLIPVGLWLWKKRSKSKV